MKYIVTSGTIRFERSDEDDYNVMTMAYRVIEVNERHGLTGVENMKKTAERFIEKYKEESLDSSQTHAYNVMIKTLEFINFNLDNGVGYNKLKRFLGGVVHDSDKLNNK